MKTAVIRYRVADFLKTYPPFDALPEQDLLELAGTGRVSFHQSHEYVFRKGQARGAVIWVIQQGRMELLDDSREPEQLHDVLSEGDLLGAGPFTDGQSQVYSARTASDVILYSIDATGFDALVKKHPAMARYLAAHTIHGEAANRSSWLEAEGPGVDGLRAEMTVCSPALRIREAAAQLHASGNASESNAIAVVDDEQKPLGLISNKELSERIATGLVSIDAACDEVMNSSVPIAPQGLNTWSYFLNMMRSRSEWLFVVSNAGGLEGIIRESDLALLCGRNPAAVARAFRKAKTIADLVRARRQSGVLLAEAVGSPETMDSCLQMATEFNLGFAAKLIQFAEAEVSPAPVPVPYCWMVFGSAGRGETFTPAQLEFGVVFADPPAGDEEAGTKYFSAVGGIVRKNLAALGYENAPEVAVGSLSAWEQRYRDWISDPILNSIYMARTMFDFQPVAGDSELARKLGASIAAGLKDSDIFIPVLANDTMSNVPPMTFFRGIVIELDGAESQTLDMERSALGPMADAARVFALATGNVAASNTLHRLEAASRALPQHEQIFRDTADAFRIVTYESAMAGRGQVNPSILSKYDQRLLKTAFQSIHRFLEFTESTYTAVEDL